MSSKFSRLSSPFQLGSLTLKNRAVMGAMHLGFEEEEGAVERLVSFYGERARGGVGLIITGGLELDYILDGFGKSNQRAIPDIVHSEGCRVLLQLMPFGPLAVKPIAPSPIASPLKPEIIPKELTSKEIDEIVEKFAASSLIAKQMNYDGVEIHASEGFLLSSFLTPKTNKRTDKWGGSAEKRMQLPLEIIRAIRKSVGSDFIISLRISLLDLIEDGCAWNEVLQFAKKAQDDQVTMFNSNVAWFESPVPTSTQMVPRGAFVWVTQEFRKIVKIPVVASHRINTPELAEKILTLGAADLISMCRPFLADPKFIEKALSGREQEINTCIACNQLCIDRMIEKKETVSCLVNPRAGFESNFKVETASQKKRIAVVGAGPAGLWFAMTAQSRGHNVTIFESEKEIGGQLNLAKVVPGKEEFLETLRYCKGQIEKLGITLHLQTSVTAEFLKSQDFDEIVIATGVTPNIPEIPGINSPRVVSYKDVLERKVQVGNNVIIIGSGPIAFDVSSFMLVNKNDYQLEGYINEWGVDVSLKSSGGLRDKTFSPNAQQKKILMLQRKKINPIYQLGKSTGWVHRAMLVRRGVKMVQGVEYREIKDDGVVADLGGQKQVLLKADTIIICSGQKSNSDLVEKLREAGLDCKVIGGARASQGLDAAAAISDGFKLALVI